MTGDTASHSTHSIKDPGAAPRAEGPIIDVEPVRAEAKGGPESPSGTVPPSAPPPRTDKAARFPPWVALAGLALIVAIGLALLILVPWSKPAPGAQQDIADRLGGLDTRLAALENKPPADPAAALEPRIAKLEGAASDAALRPTASLGDVETLRLRVDALETQLTQGQAQRAALAARIEALQASDTTHTAQTALLALAASALDDAIHMGRGFRDELSLLQRLAPGDAALAKLEPFADDGIEPVEKIAQSFPLYAQAAQDAVKAQEPAPQGFWAGAMKFFSSFVTVRDAGVAANAPVGDTLNAMNLAAAQGDLAKAVALKDALLPPAQSALAPWLARANIHLSALNAATDLRRRTIAQLAKATLAAPVSTEPTPPVMP